MPAINFEKRLIFDKAFCQDIKEGKVESTIPDVFRKLMNINSRAKGYKRVFNVMSKKDFDKVLEENEHMPRGLLRAAFYPLDKPEIEGVEDDIERNIKLAIDLLDEQFHNAYIITSESLYDAYKENSHFKDAREIDIKTGKEAMVIIDDYFSKCSDRD
tara:strand:+ start:404 stop:877 length:474 start_codon:yes stop_codon:yes gene_type:complete